MVLACSTRQCSFICVHHVNELVQLFLDRHHMVKIESLPLKLACRDITRHIHFPDRVKDAIEVQVERSMLIRIDKQLVGVLCESLRPLALLDTLQQ